MKIDARESYQVEFKKEVPKSQQILKTSVAFANGHGGRIYIGVDDGGNIVGIEENNAESLLEYLEKSIYESCTPPVFATVSTRRYQEKLVLVVDVGRGNQSPYRIASLGMDEGVFIRLGRNTVKAGVEAIQELQWRSRGISHDAIPEYHAEMDAFDTAKVLRFLRARKMGYSEREVTDDLWISYKLADRHLGKLIPTKGGILLFGKNPSQYFPEQIVICTQFADSAEREVIATVDCQGDLFAQLEQAWDFVTKRIPTAFKIKNLRREDKTEIPLEALRETIVNAVIHRSYAIPSPIKIAIFDEKIEVFSPGNFPGPIPENELESGITYIRNSVISKCFRELGLAEKLGTGFITIFKKYREFGLQLPTVIEGNNYVKVIMPRLPLLEQPAGSAEEQRIMALFPRFKTITTAIVLRETHLARATAVRRLGKLVTEGHLERIGEGAKTIYRLADSSRSDKG